MKKIIAALFSILAFSLVSFADDTTNESSTDTSHNPVTGSTTTTTKEKHVSKTGHGKSRHEMTKKVKRKKDGGTKTEVDSTHETSPEGESH